jgi:retron-type reverse transcriptase
VHIPKAGSATETRPLGIPTYEDKILQRAVLMLLEPVYETDFLDVAHGFRRHRPKTAQKRVLKLDSWLAFTRLGLI